MYDVRPEFKHVGVCSGSSSFITHLDWSVDRKYLQTNSSASERLFHQISIIVQYIMCVHITRGLVFWLSLPVPLKCNFWTRLLLILMIITQCTYRWQANGGEGGDTGIEWFSWTCVLGPEVHGIWPKYAQVRSGPLHIAWRTRQQSCL